MEYCPKQPSAPDVIDELFPERSPDRTGQGPVALTKPIGGVPPDRYAGIAVTHGKDTGRDYRDEAGFLSPDSIVIITEPMRLKMIEHSDPVKDMPRDKDKIAVENVTPDGDCPVRDNNAALACTPPVGQGAVRPFGCPDHNCLMPHGRRDFEESLKRARLQQYVVVQPQEKVRTGRQ